ncbi:efflux RND transporter periplasmic adaptor subunit [Gilvimarinus sp. SDUM040013]|uniref:Efflux RND transporter periplasmic adaptor subunit n=1 Tax=Gilvimarinus gilvus TaxID=3058038 RepID=A0ABU4S1P1_9GAMM|nr:efflux RND transporter periplasmic adaptor subunit [Gilvimarinus sp. SDUM040013]MDO3384434.1 efflux RND transporter periplasmic adaptor subunit [Gilvimarinus sp. SDUM040013]MDX6851097.1 efflux RND transporter periplasmic adaptor subunit [Gilvimarinus sp. SDUM040013]
MSRLAGLAVIVCISLAMFGCGEASKSSALTMEIAPKPFEFVVPGKGDLVSAEEVVVSAPSGNRGRLTLAWLVEENSRIEQGDIVARFDGTENRLEKQRAELELTKNELTQNITSRELQHSQFTIGQDSTEVEQEKQMVEKFSVDDLTVYSKNEIIDQLLSKDYLGAQQLYLSWLQASQQTQGQAQLELLSLTGKNFRDSIQLNSAALENLEVQAPVSGIFVHAKNWRGEKVRSGQSLWPGSKLGSIPSLDKLNARLYVLETEAAGLEMGQRARIRLDAYPEKILAGEVIALANIAAAKDTRSPTKYFEVTIALDDADPSFMRPGQKLEGEILVAQKDSALTIPNQAVFKDDSHTWVYVLDGGEFERRTITTGLRSLTQTEVVDGLVAGEEVALLEPLGESS